MFYIFELQKRTDGVINVQPTVARTSINSALSYFHERYSKMAMNEEFVSVGLTLADENLTEIEHKIVQTMYVAPTVEVEEVAE